VCIKAQIAVASNDKQLHWKMVKHIRSKYII